MREIPVFVVVPARVTLLDVAGPLEVLHCANRVQSKVQFKVRYIGPAATVLTSIGLPVTSILRLPARLPDGAMVLLPGYVQEVMPYTGRADAARAQADKQHQAEIVEWLRTVIRPGHKLISICTGALTAAQAGLLDGYDCTTHYLDCAKLAALAPKARVFDDRLYVEDGERYSSAGIMAGVDLMLHVAGQLTDEACVAAIARFLLVYFRRNGGDPQLSPWLEGRNHIHPAVHRVQDAMTRNPANAWNLSGLARIAGASSRHLSRLFHEHAGMSMVDYRNRLRVCLANELISQTQLDIEHVAERAGFHSTRQLRRAWRRLYGTTPREARARYPRDPRATETKEHHHEPMR